MAFDPITAKIIEMILTACDQFGLARLRQRAEDNHLARQIHFTMETKVTTPFRITFVKPPKSAAQLAIAGFERIDGPNEHSPRYQPVSVNDQLHSVLPSGRYRIVALYLDNQEIPEILGVGVFQSALIIPGKSQHLEVHGRPQSPDHGYQLSASEHQQLKEMLSWHSNPLRLPSTATMVYEGEVKP
ncbi:hypothetical protein [Allocatelliglobosispora scoriae]|nr:hypothetical protein [Allocatelliglobosispora scoriae]